MTLALMLQSASSSSDTIVLLICALLTGAAFLYIFNPPRQVATGVDKPRLAFLDERKDQVFENLRDLNFEFKAGKYPEADYAQMRASLEDEAAAILAEIDRLENPSRFAQPTKGAKK